MADITPAWFRRLLWNSIPSRTTRELTEAVKAMQATSAEILNDKVKVSAEGGEAQGRSDIMSALCMRYQNVSSSSLP
jgi:hypothetical protein